MKTLCFTFPFDEEVIRAVLSNVERSFREFPRTIYIVYLKAVYRGIFDKLTCLRVVRETKRHVLYQSAVATR